MGLKLTYMHTLAVPLGQLRTPPPQKNFPICPSAEFFNSPRYAYMGLELTYMGLELTYVYGTRKLTYMGLKLNYMRLKLTYMGLKLTNIFGT